uniref:Peroxisomal leader peptide-processing protease n=1 Tax=Anopheles epiroticus TaxID=199890 RepID=A0A182NZQ9_9DIPT
MKIQSTLQHGTIFYTAGGHKASAVFLDEELVITSGLILSDNDSLVQKLTVATKHNPFVELDKSTDLKQIFELDFRVVRKHENVLRQQSARAYHIVHSQRVEECMETMLGGLHVCINGDTKPVRLYAPLYATILILSTNISRCVSWNQFKTVINRLKPDSSKGPKLLDEVLTVSTPFGDESFFNTFNIGHISNIFGEHECLLLLDTHLSSGCQGGAVYNHNMKLQGILIGSTFMYRNENVSFPLAISMNEIVGIALNRRNLCQSLPTTLPIQAFRSVCMIDSQACWGTGCAFELHGRQYIISCSHVLATDNITCVFNDQKTIHPKLIYKNPIFDSAYDIALMEATFEEAQKPNWFCQLANYIPHIGQRLYAVGFPVLKSLARGINFKPSVIPGRATKYSEGILFTDCSIQCGQSGGPIFDENGLLVAIAVSNFRSSVDNLIYNCHNMCVPVADIYGTLERYSMTRDKASLEELQADWSVRCKWKLKPPAILNKL